MEGVLRRRGTKDVDLRAAGVTVRFDLEPNPLEARAGNGGARDAGLVVDADRKDSGGCTGDTTRHPPGGAPEGSDAGNCRLFQLSVGCCIYQKGKYLLGHVEGEQSMVPPRRRPPPTPPLQSRAESSSPLETPSSPHSPEGAAASRVEAPRPKTPLPASRNASEAPAHWGGGLGPRPCKEALDVVQSLRLPLSDPHYFRICEMSLLLGVSVAEEKGREVSRKRVQVLGGGDRPGDGWTGEFLVTRCAVVGNPRQPRTRADFMLSRIRVEASVYFLLLCRERYAVSIILHTKEGAVTIYYIAEMYMCHCLLKNVRCCEESPSVMSWLAILMRFVNRTTVLFFTRLVFFSRQITNEN